MVSDFAITPPNNGWRAGLCQITLTATDNKAVTSVVARISGTGASADPITLSEVANAPHHYQGSGKVPANTNSDGKANSYSVTAWAVDDAGNSTTVAQSLSFTIPAVEAPQAPPSDW